MSDSITVRNFYAEIDALRDFEKKFKEHKEVEFKKEDFGVEVWLPVDKLVVDEEVQRTLMPSQVKKIVNDFSPQAFGRLTVSKCGDSDLYYIQNGQHRAESARLLGIREVPCIVVDSKTQQQQATNFIKINQNAMQVSALDKYRIGHKAGVKEWCRVKEVVEDRCGLEVGSGQNKINAIGSIYKYLNDAKLESSIEVKMNTLEHALNILNGSVGVDGICQISILGMCIFVREYISTDIITVEDAIKRFKSLDVRGLITKAQTLKANGTRTKIVTYFAWLLYTEYNRGLKTNKLPLRIDI